MELKRFDANKGSVKAKAFAAIFAWNKPTGFLA